MLVPVESTSLVVEPAEFGVRIADLERPSPVVHSARGKRLATEDDGMRSAGGDLLQCSGEAVKVGVASAGQLLSSAEDVGGLGHVLMHGSINRDDFRVGEEKAQGGV